jgi:WD40 repeat protein
MSLISYSTTTPTSGTCLTGTQSAHSSSALVSQFFTLYHHIAHSATAKPTSDQNNVDDSSKGPMESTLKYVFNSQSHKERNALERDHFALAKERVQILQQIVELNDLIKKIHNKKMELQMEMDRINQKQMMNFNELEKMKMKVDAIRKKGTEVMNHYSPRSQHSQRDITDDDLEMDVSYSLNILSSIPNSSRRDSIRRPSLPIFLAASELTSKMFKLHSYAYINSALSKADTSYLTLNHKVIMEDNERLSMTHMDQLLSNMPAIANNNMKSKKVFDILTVKLLTNSKVLSGTTDGYLHVWDISDSTATEPELKIEVHKGWVRCISTDPKDQYAVTGGGDCLLRLHSLQQTWDPNFFNDEDDICYVDATHQRLSCRSIFYGHTGGVTCVQCDPSTIVSGSVDKDIKVWDIETSNCLRTLSGHKGYVKTLQFYYYALASGSGCESAVKLWDMRNSKCVRSFFAHEGGVSALCFDENRLVTGGRCDGTVKVFDLRIGTLLDTIQVDGCQSLQSSQPASITSLDTSQRRSSIQVLNLNVATPKRPQSIQYQKSLGNLRASCNITCLKLSGDKLIFGARGLLGPVLYDLRAQNRVKQYHGHSSHVNDLDFNENYLVTASHDVTVKVWREKI